MSFDKLDRSELEPHHLRDFPQLSTRVASAKS
jgi:hypothetical protein